MLWYGSMYQQEDKEEGGSEMGYNVVDPERRKETVETIHRPWLGIISTIPFAAKKGFCQIS